MTVPYVCDLNVYVCVNFRDEIQHRLQILNFFRSRMTKIDPIVGFVSRNLVTHKNFMEF